MKIKHTMEMIKVTQVPVNMDLSVHIWTLRCVVAFCTQ